MFKIHLFILHMNNFCTLQTHCCGESIHTILFRIKYAHCFTSTLTRLYSTDISSTPTEETKAMNFEVTVLMPHFLYGIRSRGPSHNDKELL